ncbi:MAG TPA: SCP2 sterol-binding domain-containing protein [Rhodobacteraceae bacterium]|nr:SCP2 sterol-binding domain-containing protein [Paracoccaceae bacterium]
MSEILDAAVKALSDKLGGDGIEGSIKFEIEDTGAIRIDENGASIDDSEADCTITADPEVFQDLLAGNLNPTSAFMSGKISIDGDMGMAMKLGSLLT